MGSSSFDFNYSWAKSWKTLCTEFYSTILGYVISASGKELPHIVNERLSQAALNVNYCLENFAEKMGLFLFGEAAKFLEGVVKNSQVLVKDLQTYDLFKKESSKYKQLSEEAVEISNKLKELHKLLK